MIGWRIVLPIAKHVVPLPELVRFMSASPRLECRQPARERRVTALAHRICSGRRDVTSNCLEQSLIIYRFLSELGASPSFIVGFRKQDDKVAGHAWVVVDGWAVGEPQPESSGFAPTTVFSQKS